MTMAARKIRLLLVDDHLVVRLGLRGLLETQDDMVVVAEASGGMEAVEAHAVHQPDLVLMDLRMPDMGGAEATRKIREAFPDARVLVLTTFDSDEDIYHALEAGAAGYLLKDTNGDTLFETIRRICNDAYMLPADIADRLEARRAMPELSNRERQVLELIVKGRSNKEIGSDLGVAENTVKNHVKVVLGKLGVADRTQAATEAIRRGMVRV